MKNQEIIPLKELEALKLLFIENDSEISPLYYNAIHHFLKGYDGTKEFKDYDIDFVFDASTKLPEVLDAIIKHDNILLYSSFTGESADMFSLMADYIAKLNITNKRIFTLYSKDLLNSYTINSNINEIIELDIIHNVSLYTLEDGGEFVKLTSRI